MPPEHLGRVIEFGAYLSGPLLGKHLTNFGFQVIAIRRPLTDPGAMHEFQRMQNMLPSLHKDKECIELNLKCTDDLNKAYELISDADILIENFGPGVMNRLGLSFQACLSYNPKLIYVSMKGYASGDKEFEDVKAWDSVIMASSGVFSEMGLNRTLLGIEASYSSLPMPSVYGSIFGAYAVLAAVLDQRMGEFIEIPLASCLSEALVHNSIHFPIDEVYMDARRQRIASGAYPITHECLETLMDPFFCKYSCKDDRPIYIVCPAHKRHQVQLLTTLGILDRVRKVCDMVDPYSQNEDRGIGSGSLTFEQAQVVRPILAQKLLQKAAFEWEVILGTASVPVIAHRTTEEWRVTDHVIASGLVTSDDIAPIGWLETFENQPKQVLRKQLQGLKVLDLSNVIAGPTIGSMLARLGAHVTKVDIPEPTYAPEITVIYGVVVNIGKRSALLNIMDPKGRQAFEKLVKQSDVIIVNSTEDALVRIQLNHEDVQRMNPTAILMRFDAWGGPNNTGPFQNFVGYDDNVQAAIGIMARFGGGLESAEEHAHIGTIDVIAGVAGAASVLHALLAQSVYGVTGMARCSLASVGQYLQYPFMFSCPRSTVGYGLTCKGEHLLHRCYRTRDGYIIAVSQYPETQNHVIIRRIQDTLAQMDALDEILDKSHIRDVQWAFASAGVQLMRLRRLGEVRKMYTADHCKLDGGSYQFVVQKDHPIGSLTIAAPLAVRMGGLDLTLPFAPKYGTHTMDVLTEVHMSKLVLFDKVVATSWSKTYMPYDSRCAECGTRARLVILNCCEHKVCSVCLNRAACYCTMCHEPHLMELTTLRDNYRKWKNAYNDWRRGEHKGSRDSKRIFWPDIGMKRTSSEPRLRTL